MLEVRARMGDASEGQLRGDSGRDAELGVGRNSEQKHEARSTAVLLLAVDARSIVRPRFVLQLTPWSQLVEYYCPISSPGERPPSESSRRIVHLSPSSRHRVHSRCGFAGRLCSFARGRLHAENAE